MGQEPEVLVDANPKEVVPGQEITVVVRVSPWSEDLRYFILDWDVDEGAFAEQEGGGPKEPRSLKDGQATATWIAPRTIGEHAVTVTVRAVKKGDPDDKTVWEESGSDEIEVVAVQQTVKFAIEGCPDDTVDAVAGDIICVVAEVPDVKEDLELRNVEVSPGEVARVEPDPDRRNAVHIHVQLPDQMRREEVLSVAADFAPTGDRALREKTPETAPATPAPTKKPAARKRRKTSAS